MRCAAGLFALALCLPTLCVPQAAMAASVVLKQVGPPAVYRPGGHPIDVLGISPGMGPDAVREALSQHYGNVVVTQNNLGLENGGNVVQTQNFITEMQAQKDIDQMAVWFGTPTTGNAVVEVTRQQSFRDESAAPPLQEVRAELIAKYGKPGFDGTATGSGEVLLMAWSFHGDKPSPCPHSSCRMGLSEGLDITNLPAYDRAIKSGHQLTLVVTLIAGIADPSRAAGIVTQMSDAATKYRTLETAVSQMKTAVTGPRRKEPKSDE
ncbi:MAG: hypothetical protein RQ966_07675 [Acetobacteraceae bacterium]|nr:hypothetical protein [Acetobacteraceae bacterium]